MAPPRVQGHNHGSASEGGDDLQPRTVAPSEQLSLPTFDALGDVDERFRVIGALIELTGTGDSREGIYKYDGAQFRHQPDEPLNTQIVEVAEDLPTPSGSVVSLADGVIYEIRGQVDIDEVGATTIDLGDATPLSGRNTGHDVIRTEAGGPLIRARDVPVNIDGVTFEIPGGTLFDADADDAGTPADERTEFHMNDSRVRRAGDLGTIDGFDTPSIQDSDIRDIGTGVTVTGEPNEFRLTGTHILDVADGGVGIEFADALTVGNVLMDSNVFDRFGANTHVLDVVNGPTDGGDNPVTDFGVYSDNIHDGSLSISDILSGVSFATIGWEVRLAPPLRDSAAIGQYDKDVSSTTTINTQDTYVKIAGATTAGATNERFEQNADNELTYVGTKPIRIGVSLQTSLSAANTTVGIAIFQNGSLIDTTEMEYLTQGAGNPIPAPTGGILDLVENDTMDVRVKNVGGTGNITVRRMNVNAGPRP